MAAVGGTPAVHCPAEVGIPAEVRIPAEVGILALVGNLGAAGGTPAAVELEGIPASPHEVIFTLSCKIRRGLQHADLPSATKHHHLFHTSAVLM